MVNIKKFWKKLRYVLQNLASLDIQIKIWLTWKMILEAKVLSWFHIISYHLFSFRRSVQEYKIHMDMEIVTFLGIKKWKQHNSVQQSYVLVQYYVSEEYKVFSIINIIK